MGGRLSEVWITGTGHSSCLTFVQEQCFLLWDYKFVLIMMPKFLKMKKLNWS